MMSVLGPIFRNVYMSELENKVFNTINKLNIYLRYADDFFSLIALMKLTQNNSVLNFTQEIIINDKIPFLGVLIDTSNIDRFVP